MRYPVSASVAAILILGVPGIVCAEEATDPGLDIEVETSLSTDYMDSGLTNSDHAPSVGSRVKIAYGVFYASAAADTIDYNAYDPRIEATYTVGLAPSFGDLAFDLTLARRVKYDDPSADRWKPYLTGTYTFDDHVSVSLGAGYFAYDDSEQKDFAEFYAAATYTSDNGISVTGELYYEPNSDEEMHDYVGLYGTISADPIDKVTVTGEIGYEYYEDPGTSSYLWYDASLTYAFHENVALTVGYQGNDLSSAGCPSQANTDCRSAAYAKLTLSTKLSDWVAPAP